MDRGNYLIWDFKFPEFSLKLIFNFFGSYYYQFVLILKLMFVLDIFN